MLSTGDLKWAMVKVPSYAPCQAGGRGHGPGKTPTGAWAPPCVQRVPERPGARHSCCRHKLQSPGRCRCGQRHGRSEGPEGPSRPRPLVPPLTWTLRRQRRAVGSSGPARTARTRPLRGRGHWGWAHRPGGQPSPRVCTPAPPPTLCSRHSRSWSKCVSPSAPGTEHTSRAFRNVLHLLTRLRWPPTSFCRVSQGT